MLKHEHRNSLMLRLSSALLPKLGSLGSGLFRRLARGDDASVIGAVINPTGYDSFDCFWRDYQAVSLLSKYPELNLGIDKRKVAIEKFYESERLCRETNWRFCDPLRRFHSETVDSLFTARRRIAMILGDFSWDTAQRYFNFGPGASVGLPRKKSHPCQKIGNTNPTVTGVTLPLLQAYLRWDWQMASIGLSPRIVRGAKGTTVPKNAKTDRFIAIEPQWNMFFQKGIGGMIRCRLKRFGIDLNDQGRNQELARRGSAENTLATIDLSSASDSISRGLVEFLLPEDWLCAMKTVRSAFCEVDGKELFLSKFSSMGNGFTFELESLIFFALVWACLGREDEMSDVGVYGDDLILPKASSGKLIRVLADVGFKTNTAKTFVDGPFRESCGKHYFRGRDCTPFFLKKALVTSHDLMWAANSLRRAACRVHGGYTCSSIYFDAWNEMVSCLPERLRRLSCPDGFGDDAIVRDFDEVTPRPRSERNYVQGYVAKVLSKSYHRTEFEDLPALIQFFWRVGRFDDQRAVQVMGEAYDRFGSDPDKYRIRVTNRSYPSWLGLGPWI